MELQLIETSAEGFRNSDQAVVSNHWYLFPPSSGPTHPPLGFGLFPDSAYKNEEYPFPSATFCRNLVLDGWLKS